jgi:hypothetical protein
MQRNRAIELWIRKDVFFWKGNNYILLNIKAIFSEFLLIIISKLPCKEELQKRKYN